MTRVTLTILDAMADAKLFAPWFRNRATWLAWSALLAALFGLPLTDEQLAIYRECTGRDSPPTRRDRCSIRHSASRAPAARVFRRLPPKPAPMDPRRYTSALTQPSHAGIGSRPRRARVGSRSCTDQRIVPRGVV